MLGSWTASAPIRSRGSTPRARDPAQNLGVLLGADYGLQRLFHPSDRLTLHAGISSDWITPLSRTSTFTVSEPTSTYSQSHTKVSSEATAPPEWAERLKELTHRRTLISVVYCVVKGVKVQYGWKSRIKGSGHLSAKSVHAKSRASLCHRANYSF